MRRKTKNSMKTKPQKIDITPARSTAAVVPARLVSRLSTFQVASRAVHARTGCLLSDEDRITPNSVASRLNLFFGGETKLVSRLSALVLLQVGGHALVSPSRNFGGSAATISLPSGAILEIR